MSSRLVPVASAFGMAAPVADRPGGEGAERQHAALAAVVGAEDEDDVLDGDDEDQRPEDQREDPEHRIRRQTAVARRVGRFLERIERTKQVCLVWPTDAGCDSVV